MSNLISRSEVLRAIDENGYVNCKGQEDFSANCRMDRIRQNVVEMPTAFDLEKFIAELEDLDIHFDNDYSSRNKEPMLMKQEILGLLKKYLTDTAEPPKTD